MKRIIILIFVLIISLYVFAEEERVDFDSNTNMVIIDSKINTTIVNQINITQFSKGEKNNKDFYKAEEYFNKGDYVKAKELYSKCLDKYKNNNELYIYVNDQINICDNLLYGKELNIKRKNCGKLLIDIGRKYEKQDKSNKAIEIYNEAEKDINWIIKKEALKNKLLIYYKRKDYISLIQQLEKTENELKKVKPEVANEK